MEKLAEEIRHSFTINVILISVLFYILSFAKNDVGETYKTLIIYSTLLGIWSLNYILSKYVKNIPKNVGILLKSFYIFFATTTIFLGFIVSGSLELYPLTGGLMLLLTFFSVVAISLIPGIIFVELIILFAMENSPKISEEAGLAILATLGVAIITLIFGILFMLDYLILTSIISIIVGIGIFIVSYAKSK